MNWGGSGWTAQETLVNYFTTVQDYEPEVVIIHHALSDEDLVPLPLSREQLARFRNAEHSLARWALHRCETVSDNGSSRLRNRTIGVVENFARSSTGPLAIPLKNRLNP